ncbi:MAG: primosomal protein N' [Aestuariibacter sp.]
MTQQIAAVALPIPKRQTFDYLIPADLSEQIVPGVRVEVPFGRQAKLGVVLQVKSDSPWDLAKLKELKRCLDSSPIIDEAHRQFLQWCSRYYCHPIGDVFWSALPVLLRKGQACPDLSSQQWQVSQPLPDNLSAPQILEQLNKAPKQRQLFAALTQHAKDEQALLADFSRAILNTLKDKAYIEPVSVAAKPDTFTLQMHDRPKATTEQAVAIAAIDACEQFQVFLIEGVTGSGKTEVYMQSIEKRLLAGEQILIMVPEISLTPQTVKRFATRFQTTPALWHSGLADGARAKVWQQCRLGLSRIIIGTRSAVLLPFKKLGMIIVDEEHDSSLKQQDGFRYHARDVAIVRARDNNIPLLLGSATPSLESLHNALQKRYRHLQLNRQANRAAIRHSHLLDVRKQPMHHGISEELLHKMAQHLASGHQVLVFLNRRGYAPAVVCHQCGYTEFCQQCDRPYSYHKTTRQLHCHHCGNIAHYPKNCSQCGHTEMETTGLGTERVEEFLSQRFSGFRIARVDSDNTQSVRGMTETLSAITQGEVDVLVGTQILAKGHHFPRVSMVAILDTDGALFSADFRASEQLAQLVTQVAGRTGRSNIPGELWLQTAHPDNAMLQDLIHNGYGHFARLCLQERKAAHLPPFIYQVLLRAEAVNASHATQFLQEVRNHLSTDAANLGISMAGPFPALLEKRGGRFRMQLLMTAVERRYLHHLLHQHMELISEFVSAKAVRWSVDIDPVDFY